MDSGPLADTDPFLLDSDPYSDDPFLSHFWSSDSVAVDLSSGVT